MTCYQFFVYACSYQTVLKGFKPCRCNQFCPECSVAKSKVKSSKRRWICSDYAITSFQWTSIVAVRYGDTITAPKTYFYKSIHFPYRAQVSFVSEGNLKMRWSIWIMEIIMEIYIWGKIIKYGSLCRFRFTFSIKALGPFSGKSNSPTKAVGVLIISMNFTISLSRNII